MYGNRNKFLVSTSALLMLLSYAYADIITDIYHFIGFKYELRPLALVYSLFSLLIITMLLPRNKISLVNILTIFLVMTILVPMQVLCFAGEKSLTFLNQVFVCISLIIILAESIKFLFLGWKDDVDRLMHATKTRKCSNTVPEMNYRRFKFLRIIKKKLA